MKAQCRSARFRSESSSTEPPYWCRILRMTSVGGKSISGLVKHVKIDNARQSLNRAKADLNRFSKELSDVRDLQGLNIEIGDFLTFADFFFDGFLADILVQSKIRQAQDKIDDAIIRVEEVLRQLRNYR